MPTSSAARQMMMKEKDMPMKKDKKMSKKMKPKMKVEMKKKMY